MERNVVSRGTEIWRLARRKDKANDIKASQTEPLYIWWVAWDGVVGQISAFTLAWHKHSIHYRHHICIGLNSNMVE